MENVYVLWGIDENGETPLKGYKNVRSTINTYKSFKNLKLYKDYKVCIFELRDKKYVKIDEKTISEFLREYDK